jgi:hypothetical protein
MANEKRPHRGMRSHEFSASEPTTMEQPSFVGEGEIDITRDNELGDLDREFTASRIINSPEDVLKSKRMKPSTKVKLLMEHFDWDYDKAKAAVIEAVDKVGFRRGAESYSTTAHSYSSLVTPETPSGGEGRYQNAPGAQRLHEEKEDK